MGKVVGFSGGKRLCSNCAIGAVTARARSFWYIDHCTVAFDILYRSSESNHVQAKCMPI